MLQLGLGMVLTMRLTFLVVVEVEACTLHVWVWGPESQFHQQSSE